MIWYDMIWFRYDIRYDMIWYDLDMILDMICIYIYIYATLSQEEAIAKDSRLEVHTVHPAYEPVEVKPWTTLNAW